MREALRGLRYACLPKFNFPESLIDDLNNRYYNDNEDLKVIISNVNAHNLYVIQIQTFLPKCYVNCILESFGLMRKGTINYNFAVKRIKTFLPLELQDMYIKMLTTCKDAGRLFTHFRPLFISNLLMILVCFAFS